MAVGLQSLFDQTPPPMGGMPAASAATTNPYAGFQWNGLDASKLNPDGTGAMPFNLGNVAKDLGFTGSIYDQVGGLGGGGVSGNDYQTGQKTSQAFLDWLKQNNYQLGESYGQGGYTGSGTAYNGILDQNGNVLGANSFDYNDKNGAFENLVKLTLGGMMGAAGYQALGAGGVAGGGTGGGSGGGLMEAMGGTSPVAGGGPTAGLGGFNAAMDSQAANAGGAAVWGNAGNGMTGSTVATNAPSAVDLGGLGGVMQTAGGAGGLVNAVGGNNTAAIPGGTKTLGDILKGVGGNLASNLTSPNGLAGLLGLLNANNQRNTWKDQMDELNKNFSADSPYAQMMKQRLERTDSAAGRNSQYGTREVELAAKLAEAKANAVKDLISMQDRANSAQNSGIRDLATIFGGGNNSIFSGLSTGFQDLLKLIGDGG